MNETKARILRVAEELLSELGVAKTTIAQIAKKAEVSDSLAYQYFKDKEDLVFTVAYQRLEDTWKELQEHFRGIYEARSQLGKLIWFGLNYNDVHKDYVRNLMFEYRSNRDFYSTPAYQVIRNHSRLTLQILNRGIEEGIFRDDIDMKLVREIIYGTFDFEAIGCVIRGEIEKSSDDWQDIMNLILAMIEKRPDPPVADKKDRILSCAEKVFALYGFNKSKISDVAGMAGVAEGSIYDFFENKEDLLLSITETRLREHMELLPETFNINSPVRKLRRLIRYHFGMYLRNRDFLKIFVMDNLLSKRFYTSKAFDIFSEYLKLLEGIIEEGKAEGFFRQDVNPRVFRNIFLGAFTHMSIRWIIFDQKRFDKMFDIDSLTDLLCDSITLPGERDSLKE